MVVKGLPRGDRPQETPSRGNRKIGKIVAIVLVVLVVGGGLGLYLAWPESKPKIGVINIQGEIRGFDYARLAERARKDDSIKGVVLKVNSLGGGVNGTFQTETSISKLQRKEPVVASLQEYATSGAYVVASAADNTYAYEHTTTAGLGVIAIWVSYKDYYENMGIHYYVWKTGQEKDIFAPWRKPTQEENQYIQSLVENYSDKLFLRISLNRPEAENYLDMIKDGSVVQGSQALQLNLVDNIGDFHDALKKVAEKAGLQPGEYETVNLSSYYEE